MSDLARPDKGTLSRPIPERIREAREARGLQIEVFAEMLGVTKQAVARYESGLSSPSGEVMGRIISATEQPPSFFVASRVRPGAPQPFWRGLKRMEQHHRKRILRRLEWAHDIVVYLEKFLHLPEVSLPQIDFDAATADMDDVERSADKLREHWGLGRGPVNDLSALVESNGIIFVREGVACADMDAVSCWQAGRPYILLSTEVESGPRGAFDLGHEIAHLILHATVEVTANNLAFIEKQAHRFASAFLLPQETFSREVLGTSLKHFEFLKKKWGVSMSAMAYRCKDLGIINDNQFSYVMRQMNIKNIRKREPWDDHFQIREPSILGASVRMLVDAGVQTKAQIEQALSLNATDVESLCALPGGYLGQRVVPFRPRLVGGSEGLEQ